MSGISSTIRHAGRGAGDASDPPRADPLRASGLFSGWYKPGRADAAAAAQGRRPTVALIGGGPKAHWALDALRAEATKAAAGEPIDVRIYEPHPFPGAGPVYDPRQPAWLRMNLSARHVDASGVGRGLGRLPFLTWCRRQGEAVGADDYVPRASVGRYLHACFRRSLGEGGAVAAEVVPERVEALERRDGRWLVRHGGGLDAADAVLLTTGHGLGPCDGLAAGGMTADGRLPAYPAHRLGRVAAGRPADVKGLSLTFIDVALSLTEGRGGRFHEDPSGSVYERGGREPSRIVAWSRSGRMMAPKPLQSVWDSLMPGEPAQAAWRNRVALMAAGPLTPGLTDTLCRAASRIRADAGERRSGPGDARAWLEHCDRGSDPAAGLRRSLDAAEGREAPDWPTAFGMAWRSVYAAVIAVVSHRRWAPGDAAAFRRLAGEMERVGFGPPASNAARIDALLRDGLLSVWAGDGAAARGCRVDARIAPARPQADPLAGPLVRSGRASLDADFGALRVGPDLGVCEGLSAFSRLCEGVVLGHDSLVRTHHPQVAAWARATAAALA